MNPFAFARNLAACWRERITFADVWRRMIWLYSHKIPPSLRRSEQIIGFTFPLPLGKVRLLVRCNGGSDAFIVGEVFHHQYYNLPLATAPATILDLGANAGFTAVYFQRRFPKAKVLCVEPMSDNVRVLAANCDLNNVVATIITAAVAERDGIVSMACGAMDYGHHVVEGKSAQGTTVTEVKAVSVPSLMRSNKWDRIGLLKVDIEGYEKVLFAGDCPWLRLVDAMCIECHEGFGEDELYELARYAGFLVPEKLPGIWLLKRARNERLGPLQSAGA